METDEGIAHQTCRKERILASGQALGGTIVDELHVQEAGIRGIGGQGHLVAGHDIEFILGDGVGLAHVAGAVRLHGFSVCRTLRTQTRLANGKPVVELAVRNNGRVFTLDFALEPEIPVIGKACFRDFQVDGTVAETTYKGDIAGLVAIELYAAVFQHLIVAVELEGEELGEFQFCSSRVRNNLHLTGLLHKEVVRGHLHLEGGGVYLLHAPAFHLGGGLPGRSSIHAQDHLAAHTGQFRRSGGHNLEGEALLGHLEAVLYATGGNGNDGLAQGAFIGRSGGGDGGITDAGSLVEGEPGLVGDNLPRKVGLEAEGLGSADAFERVGKSGEAEGARLADVEAFLIVPGFHGDGCTALQHIAGFGDCDDGEGAAFRIRGALLAVEANPALVAADFPILVGLDGEVQGTAGCREVLGRRRDIQPSGAALLDGDDFGFGDILTPQGKGCAPVFQRSVGFGHHHHVGDKGGCRAGGGGYVQPVRAAGQGKGPGRIGAHVEGDGIRILGRQGVHIDGAALHADGRGRLFRGHLRVNLVHLAGSQCTKHSQRSKDSC